MFGFEASFDRSLPLSQRLYIRFLGAPEIGARIRWRIARRFLDKLNFLNCLDAGCGKGYFSFWLARRYPDRKVVGLDIDQTLITRNNEIRKKLDYENLCFRKENLLDLDYKDDFDLIISIDNLEHINDDRDVLMQLRKALNDNGLICVHVPKREKRFFFRSSGDHRIPGHVRDGYQVKELSDLLVSAGYQPIYIEEQYNFFQTLANEIGTMLSHIIWLYALFMPVLDLLSLVPTAFSDKIRYTRNSVLAIARPTSNERPE